MRVLGIDPAKEIASKASLDGVETIPKFFSKELAERLKVRFGPANFITSHNKQCILFL